MLVKNCKRNSLLISLSLCIVVGLSSQIEVDIVCSNNVISEEFLINDFDNTIRTAKAVYENRQIYKNSFLKLKGLVFKRVGLFHFDQHDMKPFGSTCVVVFS